MARCLCLELGQEGPNFFGHPRGTLTRIVGRWRVPAVIGAPPNGISGWTTRVGRTNVAARRCSRKRCNGATVPLRKLIGLGVLAIALSKTKRAKVGNWLARGGIGNTAARVANCGAKHSRTGTGERPRHSRALAEPLQHDTRGIDTKICLDRLQNVIHEGRIRRGAPKPAVRGGRYEDSAVIRERKKPEVRWPNVGILTGCPVQADDQPVRVSLIVVVRPPNEKLSALPGAGKCVLVGCRRTVF